MRAKYIGPCLAAADPRVVADFLSCRLARRIAARNRAELAIDARILDEIGKTAVAAVEADDLPISYAA